MAKVSYGGWEIDYYTMNGAYPVPSFTAEIGKDGQGRTWFVRVAYRMESSKQEVLFDYSADGERPFLKDEVIGAEDYCKAQKEVYHMKVITYRQFNEIVENFMKENGIK